MRPSIEAPSQTKPVTWQDISELPEADASNQSTGNLSRRQALKVIGTTIGSAIAAIFLPSCVTQPRPEYGNSTPTEVDAASDQGEVIESFENLRRTQVASVKWLPVFSVRH